MRSASRSFGLGPDLTPQRFQRHELVRTGSSEGQIFSRRVLPASYCWHTFAVVMVVSFLFPVLDGLADEASGSGPLIAIGVGYYDFAKRSDTAVDLRLEYRSDLELSIVRPWLGLEVTTDGAVYGVAGGFFDLDLDPHWILTPSAGVGAYHDGGGKNLGSTLEFRLQAEIAYRFEDESRLSLAFSHLSNARIGSNNPGAEILTLYYMVPLNRLF